MPLTRPPDRRESTGVYLDRTNLHEFRQKALLYGAGTLAALVVWIAAWDRVPFQLAVPVVGALAIEAIRNLRRWREWLAVNPGAERVHPDHRKAIEQQTVRIMADAVRSRAWLTRAIVACVAVPSMLQLFVGLERSVELASVDPVAVRAGEWWRLLGGTYLHGSYYHFTGNMGALLVYGSILEAKTSRLRLPLVYVLSCLAGSAASVAVPPDVPSIGASGGVVGVIGYLYVFSRRQEVRFPAAFRGATASVFAGLITAGALGFWYIDNPGHAGGAIMGIFLAGLIVDTARNFDREIDLPLLDLLGWVAMALLVAGAAMTCQRLVAG